MKHAYEEKRPVGVDEIAQAPWSSSEKRLAPCVIPTVVPAGLDAAPRDMVGCGDTVKEVESNTPAGFVSVTVTV